MSIKIEELNQQKLFKNFRLVKTLMMIYLKKSNRDDILENIFSTNINEIYND